MRKGFFWGILSLMVGLMLILLFLDYIDANIPVAQLFGDAIRELREFWGELRGVAGS